MGRKMIRNTYRINEEVESRTIIKIKTRKK
jgi:hypothetical protein